MVDVLRQEGPEWGVSGFWPATDRFASLGRQGFRSVLHILTVRLPDAAGLESAVAGGHRQCVDHRGCTVVAGHQVADGLA